MAVVTQTPTNYSQYVDVGTVSAGLAANFRANLNGYIGSVENKVQVLQAYVEQLHAFLGNGAIFGGTLAAGSGLNVTHGTLSAYVGNIVQLNAAGTIGGLTNAATNYIYLRQDGTWTVNTTGVMPGTSDNHGTAILWGTAVTSGGVVTAVGNVRPYFGGTVQTVAMMGRPEASAPFAWGSARSRPTVPRSSRLAPPSTAIPTSMWQGPWRVRCRWNFLQRLGRCGT